MVADYRPASQRADWHRYVAGLWRYKWLILVLAVLGGVAGKVGTRFIKTRYEAQARLWIQSPNDPKAAANQTGPVQGSGLLQSNAWADLLKSYVVLDSVVMDLQLYLAHDPEDAEALAGFGLGVGPEFGEYRFVVSGDGEGFGLWRVEGERVEEGVVGDSVGRELGFRWVPGREVYRAGRTIEFTVTDPRDRSSGLARGLTAKMDSKGSFLSLSMKGQNPQRVTQIVNAVAERYIEVAASLKREKLAQIAEILNEQRTQAEGRLGDVESSLETFRAQTLTLPSEGATPVAAGLQATQNPAFTNFFDLKIEREQLRRDREAIRAVLEQAADSGLSVHALEFIEAVETSSQLQASLSELTAERAELRALRNSYSEEHRLVRRSLRRIAVLEQETIPGLAERLIDTIKGRESELDALIASASGELSRIPPRVMAEAALQRRVDIAAEVYTELQLRHEEALLATAASIPDIRLLDEARPPREPIKKTPGALFVVMGLLGGLGVGAVGAVLLERVDPRLKYPDQVSGDLGLPILGTVPHVRAREMGSLSGAEIVEAFRVVRLNARYAYGAGYPMMVAISSPGGGDGKSFVTANLALAFADLGQRTLVIDADVRRGGLHRVLGGSRRPGLSDFLAGAASISQVITRAGVSESLYLLASGTRRQNGPELLQSARMTELLTRLRADFDVVLVDTPPLGVGDDALAIATLLGNVIMVLRTGATNRGLTAMRLDLLERLPVRVLGAILNAVPDRGVYRLGQYYGYSSYLPGYESEDEVGASVPSRVIDSGLSSSRELEGNPSAWEGSPIDDGQRVAEAAGNGTDPETVTSPEEVPQAPESPQSPTEELHRQHQRRCQLRQWK